MNNIQKAELDILKEFDKVCEKLNVKYYLHGGTLLGGIRHKGFIPWDDDIDVIMLREDYDVFIKKGQELLPENLFIQNIETDKNCTIGFSKVRNSNTTFIETTSKKLDINHGVFIDVFVLDNYKKNFFIDKINFIRAFLLRIQLSKYYYLPNKKKLRSIIIRKISNIFYSRLNNKQILDKLIKMATRYKNVECNYGQMYLDFNVKVNALIYNKAWFGDGIIKEFEDMKVRVPKDYETILTMIYGDWRKLPPKDQQVGHHYAEVIDLNKSYKEYLNLKGDK